MPWTRCEADVHKRASCIGSNTTGPANNSVVLPRIWDLWHRKLRVLQSSSVKSVVFTALHEMQTRYSNENSVCLPVCLSVCLSVRHTRDPWQNGRKIGPDFYTIRKNIYPSFLRRRMVGGGRPLLRKILGQRPPFKRNRRFSINNRS